MYVGENNVLSRVVGDGNNSDSGENGATFTPHLSEDCTLYWTNDKGLENLDLVNIKGHQGEQGEKGEQGDTD